MSAFAEVILPLPLHGTFTYSIPPTARISPGTRVVVSFGKKKIYTAIVFKIHDGSEVDFEAKPILEVLDEAPIVNEAQLKFFQWMSRYYMCSLGEVMNAALPAALKLSSESFVGINPEINPDDVDVDDREWELLQTLRNNNLSVKEVSEVLHLKQPQRILKNLSEKGFIDLFEKLKDKYQPKKVKRVRLQEDLVTESQLEALLNTLESKPKQQDVLLSYLRDVPVLEHPEANVRGILKSSLLAEGISQSSLKTLLKNDIFEEWEETVSRLGDHTSNQASPFELSTDQSATLEAIKESFRSHRTVLLHGSTGSGKTEI